MTFLKLCDYMRFKWKIKRTKFKPFSLEGKNLKAAVTEKGISLYYNGVEFTRNMGFHSTLKNLERWHDTTQADWYTYYFRNSKTILKQYWWNLPLQQIWKITLDTDNKIIWLVEMEVESYINIEEIKIGLILSSVYSQLNILCDKITLPKLDNEWACIKFIPKTNEIIIRSDKSTETPGVKFSVVSALFPYEFIVQNTDRYLDGRYVQLGFLEENEFVSGRYRLCEININLIE